MSSSKWKNKVATIKQIDLVRPDLYKLLVKIKNVMNILESSVAWTNIGKVLCWLGATNNTENVCCQQSIRNKFVSRRFPLESQYTPNATQPMLHRE